MQEQESKINFLRNNARARYKDVIIEDKSEDVAQEHIQLFENIGDESPEYKKDNEKYLADKKEEKEKYEKQVGYLTYLGKSADDTLGIKQWYDELPDRKYSKVEVNIKSKATEDPLNVMQRYLDKTKDSNKISIHKTKPEDLITIIESKIKSKKSSKHKYKKKKKRRDHSPKNRGELSTKSSSKRHRSCVDSESESEQNTIKKKRLENLRKERLERERLERIRAEQLLKKEEDLPIIDNISTTSFKQKYNSQYNPTVAKQNITL